MTTLSYSSTNGFTFTCTGAEPDITVSSLRITDTPTNGYVLTSNANGDGTWQVIPTGVWTDSGSVIYPTILRPVLINTTALAGTEQFRVLNGAVIFDGTTGGVPVSGAGTRLLWAPAKSALRAGTVSAAQWDSANVGTNSVAFGSDTTASGTQSFAHGSGTVASGAQAVALGSLTTVSGDNALAIGSNTPCAYNNTFALANGFNATTGDIYSLMIPLKLVTTNATWTTLTTDGAAASASNIYLLDNDSAIAFFVIIVGKNSTTGTEAINVTLTGGMRRGTGAASTALVGNVTRVMRTNSATFSARAQADTTLGGLSVQIIGATSQTVRWHANLILSRSG